MSIPEDAPANPVEIFRSLRMSDCDQQTLILAAVGIHSWTVVRGGIFVVVVAEESAALALQHLTEVARENVPPPPAPKPLPLHPRGWPGAIIYALVLMGVAYAAGRNSFDLNWLEAGALEGALATSREWWRVATALTLHADVGHLVSNLLFGVGFGYLAARAVGNGVAWAGILIGALFGNALDALWMPADHQSIGASTAVFSALGLLSAYGWMLEDAANAPTLKWARRFGPLIAGVMLLGLLGAGGERTDVVAHITGFVGGCALGVIIGKIPARLFQSRALQFTTGALAIAIIAVAWLVALL